ncbi:hypothetical protein PRIPAC_76857 [Pristionchus pacificus]|uniref:Uncharacterized protein n=1 Tax=Pristionchus pacificus TaxID=54126 RepID=A0A2A6C2W2_PRIPA|nr:hypothetical protein PRIPAC_76857 [Pristionchus pacificus]|eukprot:PDM72371.1 hypothetical protein PRIPAC_38805 [Pristionchus pacificus]
MALQVRDFQKNVVYLFQKPFLPSPSLRQSRSFLSPAQFEVRERVPGFTVDAVSSLAASYMRRKAHGGVKGAIGQFTVEEYDEMLRNDLIQLQNVLGDNQFLMGDPRVDCLALGHIGHAYFRLPQSRSYIHELIDSAELSPFKQYLERVVKTLF